MFLLTRPMRDVTTTGLNVSGLTTVSTHTPHAGRDSATVYVSNAYHVSTHTPHAGRDNIRLQNTLFT